MKKLLFIIVLSVFFVGSLSASTKTLTYNSVLNKGKTIPVKVKWRIQDLKDSSVDYNNDLAKISVVLARNIYVSNKAIKQTIKKLGYSKFWLEIEENEISKPVTAFAHQKRSNINYYLIVVRGTGSFKDFLTDMKASSDFFSKSAFNIMKEFDNYLELTMKKSKESVKTEKNVFFVVGHSLGGSVANLLSKTLEEYAEKNSIFTYTFESPSTGVYEEESSFTNSINIINEADLIPNLPSPEGRYGRDVRFWPHELNPELYKKITGEELDTIAGFTLTKNWNNHILDTSLAYVLSREQGLLVNIE